VESGKGGIGRKKKAGQVVKTAATALHEELKARASFRRMLEGAEQNGGRATRKRVGEAKSSITLNTPGGRHKRV